MTTKTNVFKPALIVAALALAFSTTSCQKDELEAPMSQNANPIEYSGPQGVAPIESPQDDQYETGAVQVLTYEAVQVVDGEIGFSQKDEASYEDKTQADYSAGSHQMTSNTTTVELDSDHDIEENNQ
jgi:hypothetical protein